jgi:hypothetical protein
MFEYDFLFGSVIVSLLVGIALSKLIESWGRIVQQKKTIKSSILFLLISSWLFSFFVAHWLGLWQYRDIEIKSVLTNYILFLPSLIGALSTYILTPVISENLDVEKFYFSMAPRSHLIMGVFVISAGLTDLMIPEYKGTSLTVFIIMGGLLIFLSRNRNRRLHLILISVLWVAWILGLILEHYKILI